jgi:hypothetical protein
MNQPDDLDDLERDLRDHPFPEPSPAFRRQVLDAMLAEARRSQRPARAHLGGFAAVAAALMLAINLSMSVANDSDFRFAAPAPRGQIRDTVAQVRALFPELTEDEALRHALALQAGSGRAVPAPPAFSKHSLTTKEP